MKTEKAEEKYNDIYASIENLERFLESLHMSICILGGRLENVSRKHDVVDELNQDISFKKTYLGGRIQKSAFKTELALKRVDAIIKHLEL